MWVSVSSTGKVSYRRTRDLSSNLIRIPLHKKLSWDLSLIVRAIIMVIGSNAIIILK